jgi:CRISPR-associated exonuclease Cas4
VYLEDELLPLSALQHLSFCERQCALIYVEQIWEENVLTIEGAHLHERVDETGRRFESRGDVRITRGLPLRSLRLGLAGRADVVEFHRLSVNLADAQPGNGLARGVPLPEVDGLWRPFPVEYKRGSVRNPLPNKVQLCAQALCLEEMLGVVVPDGALFHGVAQRRLDILFDVALRERTEVAAQRLHELVASRVTPPAVKTAACGNCSLVTSCRPEVTSGRRSVRRYLRDAVSAALGRGGEETNR